MSLETDPRDDDGDELVPAAVVVPEIPANESTQLLFTRRAPDLDTHPGQMSFPGGRKDPGDDTLLDTALRETREEVGIDPTAVEIVGRLDPITTVTGFYVEPYIGRIPDGPFTPQRSEVAEVVSLSIDSFLDERSYEQERRTHPVHGTVAVHYFYVDGYTVWGATGSLLVQYLERTAGWSPPADA